MITKIWNWLKGKKTYGIALATVIFAVSGAATGQFSWQHAWELILGSGAIASLRHGSASSAPPPAQ